jgi:hypothetical protein
MPGVRGICDKYIDPNLPAPINAIRIGFESWALCCNFLYKDIKTPIEIAIYAARKRFAHLKWGIVDFALF